MSSVHETAYPRLKLEFTEQELIAIYSPTPAEVSSGGCCSYDRLL